MPRLHSAVCRAASTLAAACALAGLAHATTYTHLQETPRFKTEPDFMHTYFVNDFMTNDTHLLAPGYIFLAPLHGPDTRVQPDDGRQLGPEIREQDGTLIWWAGTLEDWGSKARQRKLIRDFRSCDYKGEKGTHLCWSESATNDARKHVIFNNKYMLVSEEAKMLLSTPPDMHEFHMVDNGWGYCDVVNVVASADLSPFGGPQSGRYFNGCFQEVSTETHTSTFSWCWTRHLDLWETTLFPYGAKEDRWPTTPKSGEGTAGNPYDPMHLNSIDKTTGGDYLVSARHVNQILLIAGPDNAQGVEAGTVIWRLGGPNSTIAVEGAPFNFSRQHGIRSIRSSPIEDVVSFMNNAWEGASLPPSSSRSSGMIVSINRDSMTARMIREYPHPTGSLSPSQGNFQLLPNENAFVDWGFLPSFSEFTYDGQLLAHTWFTNDTRPKSGIDGAAHSASYRVWKAEWRGEPTWSPKLISYSRFCKPHKDAPLTAWVSWNGATEVKSWRFSIAQDAAGPWVYAGTFPRTGFETKVLLSGQSFLAGLTQTMFPTYVSVQALGPRGEALAHGDAIASTFVPSVDSSGVDLSDECNEHECLDEFFDYADAARSAAQQCAELGSDTIPRLAVLGMLLFAFEYIDYTYITLITLTRSALRVSR